MFGSGAASCDGGSACAVERMVDGISREDAALSWHRGEGAAYGDEFGCFLESAHGAGDDDYAGALGSEEAGDASAHALRAACDEDTLQKRPCQ